MGTESQTPAEVLSGMELDLLEKRADVVALLTKAQEGDVNGALADLRVIDKVNLDTFHQSQETTSESQFGMPGIPYEEARREGSQIRVLRGYLEDLAA